MPRSVIVEATFPLECQDELDYKGAIFSAIFIFSFIFPNASPAFLPYPCYPVFFIDLPILVCLSCCDFGEHGAETAEHGAAKEVLERGRGVFFFDATYAGALARKAKALGLPARHWGSSSTNGIPDLSKEVGVQRILVAECAGLTALGWSLVVRLASPPRTFSRAHDRSRRTRTRSAKYPAGTPPAGAQVLAANEIAKRVVSVPWALADSGAVVSIEGPDRSYVWLLDCFESLLEEGWSDVRVSPCRFGAGFDRPVMLRCHGQRPDALEGLCCLAGDGVSYLCGRTSPHPFRGFVGPASDCPGDLHDEVIEAWTHECMTWGTGATLARSGTLRDLASSPTTTVASQGDRVRRRPSRSVDGDGPKCCRSRAFRMSESHPPQHLWHLCLHYPRNIFQAMQLCNPVLRNRDPEQSTSGTSEPHAGPQHHRWTAHTNYRDYAPPRCASRYALGRVSRQRAAASPALGVQGTHAPLIRRGAPSTSSTRFVLRPSRCCALLDGPALLGRGYQ